jgi:hypothetical protein
VVASIRRIETSNDRRHERRSMTVKLAAATAALMLVMAFSYYFAHNNEGIVTMISRAPRTSSDSSR